MKTLSFKVSDDEARLIRSQAKRERLSLSEFLRRRASVKRATSTKFGATTKCKVTGATIFLGSPELPPLNNESVREMLSDFP